MLGGAGSLWWLQCSVPGLSGQCLSLHLAVLALREQELLVQHTGQGQAFNVWIKSEVSHEGCQQGIHTQAQGKREMQTPCLGPVLDEDLLKTVFY